MEFKYFCAYSIRIKNQEEVKYRGNCILNNFKGDMKYLKDEIISNVWDELKTTQSENEWLRPSYYYCHIESLSKL